MVRNVNNEKTVLFNVLARGEGENTATLSIALSTRSFKPASSFDSTPISLTNVKTAFHISSTASVSQPRRDLSSSLLPLEPDSRVLAIPWRYVSRRTDGLGSGAVANCLRRSSMVVECLSVTDGAEVWIDAV